MKKRSYPVVNIGIVPVFTICVILCMVTFAVLSYMSADRDFRFSSQVAEQTTAYYDAVNEANQQIASLNQTLLDSWNRGVYEQTESSYAFSVPVSDTKELIVELTRIEPQPDGSCTRIERFEETSTTKWHGDDSLNLIK
ncbi:MAG: hypothetical protein PHG16_06205 [Lachnospiraceae bacterium]|nr:hypothetical protein [Lachnospiraceae bacterium]